MATSVPERKAVKRPRFFLGMAVLAVVVAVAGFSTTFFVPMVAGHFRAPLVIHLHGALFFGWVLLLVLQSALVQRGQLPWHRLLGWYGTALATGMVTTGVAVGVWVTRRDLTNGLGEFAKGQFLIVVVEMLVFATLVGLAIWKRRQGAAHKRLMLLATISILGPAWFRFRHFLPWVENPIVVFSIVADSLLLVAMLYDRLALARVHRVYWWAGLTMVAVHVAELAFAETEGWIGVGAWLYGVLG